jgi:hypothetical protein
VMLWGADVSAAGDAGVAVRSGRARVRRWLAGLVVGLVALGLAVAVSDPAGATPVDGDCDPGTCSPCVDNASGMLTASATNVLLGRPVWLQWQGDWHRGRYDPVCAGRLFGPGIDMPVGLSGGAWATPTVVGSGLWQLQVYSGIGGPATVASVGVTVRALPSLSGILCNCPMWTNYLSGSR